MSDPASMNLASTGLASDVRSSLRLIGPKASRRLALLATLQALTGLLDLVGILLFGAVGVMAASASQGNGTPERLQFIQEALGLEGWSAEGFTLLLGAVTAAFLIAKSVSYAFILRRIYQLLGASQREVGIYLGTTLLRARPTALEDIPRPRLAYAVFHGTYQAITSLLGSSTILLAEFFLLAILSVALLVIDPILMAVAAGYFAAIAVGVHRLLAKRAQETGSTRARSSVEGYQHLQESLAGQREMAASGRIEAFAGRVRHSVKESADAAARELFLGQLPKLLYEGFMVVAAVGIVTWQIARSDLTSALGVLVIFLAASARLLPSMLRINAQLLSARSSAAQAQPAYELAEILSASGASLIALPNMLNMRDAADPTPTIAIEHVHFSYPGSSKEVLRDVCLTIPAGSLVGIAGHSGAGKSTLADVILGINPPSRGEVLVGGVAPAEVAARWPGYMAYLPQDVAILNSSIRANVLFGVAPEEAPDEAVWEALREAHLETFVQNLPLGLDTLVGDNGAKLSGGQRQRLGLARVMLTSPRLIVFDEATSALDPETEKAVSDAVLGPLDSSVPCTRIVIAHRLATLMHADVVIFLDEGRILGVGTFDDLRSKVPAFDRQASLLGIDPTRQ